MKVAEKRYFANADKSKLVEEGSDEAAYLVVAEGSEVTAEMEEKYGIKGVEKEEPVIEPGIVTTSEGPEGDQGFVAADKAREAGVLVTGDRDAEAAEEKAKAEAEGKAKAAPKKAAKKSSKKAK